MALELDPLVASALYDGRPAVSRWLRRALEALSARRVSVITRFAASERGARLSGKWAVAIFNLGVSRARDGQSQAAVKAYGRVAESTHADVAAKAAFNLGVLSTELGQLDSAAGAFTRAISSAHADVAPKAAFNLGVLLTAQGDLQGAADAYEHAIEFGHDNVLPRAASNFDAIRWELVKLSLAAPSAPEPIDLSSEPE
jgi:tetratricopeptide (TPR) repeat protein